VVFRENRYIGSIRIRKKVNKKGGVTCTVGLRLRVIIETGIEEEKNNSTAQ